MRTAPYAISAKLLSHDAKTEESDFINLDRPPPLLKGEQEKYF